METTVQVLLVLGGLLLMGTLVDTFGKRTAIPRVTLLMALGILVSAEGLNLLPEGARDWFSPIVTVALMMVGFLLGEKFTAEKFRLHGREVLWISIGASVGTSIVVTVLLLLLGIPFPLAILLGGIAAATDPAATVDVVNEFRGDGEFADKLLGVVALDDAWGLIVFSLCASLALLSNGDGDTAAILQSTAWEIGGAVLLGLLIGFPAAALTGRLEPGQPTLVEALGVVFICGGLAMWLEVSYLISAMTLGTVIANFAAHHDRPFHEIEGIEGPFLILFFLLAGASLELASLESIGFIVFVYIATRLLGKILGGWLGGIAGASDVPTRRWAGLALSPQAGVAIGMALIAIERFPEYRDILLPTVITSTVVFELVGPILTRIAVRKAGGTAG